MKPPAHMRPARTIMGRVCTTLSVVVALAASAASAQEDTKQSRAAQNAYLSGARKLQHDDLTGAQADFAKAAKLDPDKSEYGIAVTIAREHAVNALVQKASNARLTGDAARAESLLAEARTLDPSNPLLLAHNQPALGSASAQAPNPTSPLPPLSDRAQLLAAGDTREPWKITPPVLAGALHLKPSGGVKSFHIRGDVRDALQQVASAYGIRPVFDDPVERKNLRFDMDDQPYDQAMAILLRMAHLFAVPLDESSVLIAQDTPVNRQRLERLMEETIFLPGMTPEEINDLANLIRNIFEVKQATVQPTLQTIVVRTPEDTLGPMNRTLGDLIDSTGEIMLEVKFYEVSTTHTRNIGATLPTQAGIYNVDAAATSLVNANQSLVQEAIAQGLVSSSASNLLIAGALIASGLVQSSLLSSTIGIFGNGLTTTGITESGTVGFNLALNSTDTRALDDVQMRVDDRKPGVFRAGTRYPVTTSTYSTGLSTAASALSSATINGVSVASLLAQYAGGTSTTIPQVSYEDLGVTLTATPAIQKSGRVNLLLDMKIEALAGGSANGIPNLASRALTSDITVGDGETVLLVTSTTRNESAAVTGLPGLSELPGFQAPLDQNAEKDTGQLVVMVTPHVVRRRTDTIAGPRLMVRAQDTVVPVN